jgi:hypothetical protein
MTTLRSLCALRVPPVQPRFGFLRGNLITPKQYTRYVRQYTCTLTDRSVGSTVYCIPKSLNLEPNERFISNAASTARGRRYGLQSPRGGWTRHELHNDILDGLHCGVATRSHSRN